MYSIGLTKAGRIGEGVAPVDAKTISVSGSNGEGYLPVLVVPLHRVAGIRKEQLDAFGQRRPNDELRGGCIIPGADL
jgi:hypothetical protein